MVSVYDKIESSSKHFLSTLFLRFIASISKGVWMILEYSDLQLLKYLQENNDVLLTKAALDFYRNPSSIRRQLASINHELAGRYPIVIYNNHIRSGLTYSDYLDIIQDLSLETYIPSCKERMQFIIIKSFFEEIVNLTHLYENLGFSVTTKKSDTSKLRPLLAAYGQAIQVVKKKGIEISGDELRFRMLAIEILLPLIEWDPDLGITGRRANTPIQAAMADSCIRSCLSPAQLRTHYPALFEKIQDYHLSYQSRKLLSLYLTLSAVRQTPHPVTATGQLMLTLPVWTVLDNPLENTALLHILAMLDFAPVLDTSPNPALLTHAANLCSTVNRQTGVSFFHPEEVHREIYHYLYKVYFQDFYGIQMKDKMVRNTEQYFPELYQTICTGLIPAEKEFHIHFHAEHYTTLTLILQKWINYHQLSGQNRKTIVLVTNTSSERSRFFISSLEDLVEFNLCAIISIQELERLAHLAYDYIITLSDRTAGLLADQGLSSLRLDFFLGTVDLEKLLAAGFDSARKRLSAKKIADSLNGLSTEEIAIQLKKDYPEYFI